MEFWSFFFISTLAVAKEREGYTSKLYAGGILPPLILRHARKLI